jgi:L-histidine Nalpha-methyltransferase
MSHPLVRPEQQGWRRVEEPGFLLHLDTPGNATLGFAASVLRGMEAYPRQFEPRWLYDSSGSEIYERITEQPEYYPTRTEDRLLARHADEIRSLVGDVAVVELGSGSSTKTRHILDAWVAQGPSRYVPIDISRAAVSDACSTLAEAYPTLQLEGIASTYARGVELIRDLGPRMVLFLGSTIGNMGPEETQTFLEMISDSLAPGDWFLLGVDLVKSTETLEAAYDDAAGWTASFFGNLAARINTELEATLPLEAVRMVSYYNVALSRVEMYLAFDEACELQVGPLKKRYRIAAGEQILAEISRKFEVENVASNAARFDLSLERRFVDEEHPFAVLLFQRVASAQTPIDGRTRQLRQARTRLRELVEVMPSSEAAADVDWDDFLSMALAQERLLERIQADATIVYSPPFQERPPTRPMRSPVGEYCFVPGGQSWMGDDDLDFDGPRHQVELAPYHIGSAPVTNGEYLMFVLGGGYQNRALWTEAGWKARVEGAWVAPAHWTLRQGLWRSSWFGHDLALDPLRPVLMVSAHEAEAYARWVGKRLPSEKEWEKAAAWDAGFAVSHRWPWGAAEAGPTRVNLGQRVMAATAVGSYPEFRSFYGCHQMIGDAWEWTSSAAIPYPGSSAQARPGRVLRGGSFASATASVGNARREASPPSTRTRFTGFRLAF